MRLLITLSVLFTLTCLSMAQDCALIVPAHPLTAAGLASPYYLVSLNSSTPCRQAGNGTTFVQGAIVDLQTGKLYVYNPLVVDFNTVPAAAPVVPVLPSSYVAALWFGTTAKSLTLVGDDSSLADAQCVNGLNVSVAAFFPVSTKNATNPINTTTPTATPTKHPAATNASTNATSSNTSDTTTPLEPPVITVNGSLFGQSAYCNAPAFFLVVNSLITQGKIYVPKLGKTKDGCPCPTVRSFLLVDPAPGTGLVVQYLLTQAGQVAQDTAANRAAFPNATVLNSGADALIVAVNKALNCSSFLVPDLADANSSVASLPMNQIMAAWREQDPVALVPAGAPAVLVTVTPASGNLTVGGNASVGVNASAGVKASRSKIGHGGGGNNKGGSSSSGGGSSSTTGSGNGSAGNSSSGGGGGDNTTTTVTVDHSLDKLNLYRIGLGQDAVDSLNDASTKQFCANLGNVFPKRIMNALTKKVLTALPSPYPAVATNLYTYLSSVFVDTFNTLNCSGALQLPICVDLKKTGDVVTGVDVNASLIPPDPQLSSSARVLSNWALAGLMAPLVVALALLGM